MVSKTTVINSSPRADGLEHVTSKRTYPMKYSVKPVRY